MRRTSWTRRAALRYFSLQVPGWFVMAGLLFVLWKWLYLPMAIFWIVLSLWILKDFAIFPFLWRAYDANADGDPMSGLCGRAEERLDPVGYVRVQGERWRARLAEGSPPVENGGMVMVRGREGLTLIVQYDEEGRRE